MPEAPPDLLVRADGERLAYRARSGAAPTLVWLSGFASDMDGSKAEALDAFAAAAGQAMVRFDYFGHGASTGALVDGTVGRWIEDALEVVDRLTQGPLILVGSSMGAFIAAHLSLLRPLRTRALLLIAPALDFTSRLIEPSLSAEARAAIALRGRWTLPSAYAEGGLALSRALLEDGRARALLPGPIPFAGPVRILQGGADPDVPWAQALETARAFAGPDVVFTLIRDGDHRLSRPKDLKRLADAARELCGGGP